MSYNNNNNKSIVQEMVPGMLIKIKKGLDNHINYNINYEDYDNSKDRFYILTEIEIEDEHGNEDILVFYGLTEERFFSSYRWYIEESIDDGTADIVA